MVPKILAHVTLAAVLAGCVVVPVPIPMSSSGTPSSSAALYAKAGDAPASAACPLPADASARRAEVLRLVNAQRKANGLKALSTSDALTDAAQGHACDNVYQGGYSHVGSDGSDLRQRLLRVSYRPRIAVENTGWGFGQDSARLVDFWMNSDYHRANILNPKVTQFGLGVARSDGGKTSWVMNLAKRL